MRALLQLITLISLIGLASCNRPANPVPSILGRYELVGYNNSEQRVFTGTISLTSLDQKYMNGQCSIVREREAAATILDQNPRCQALLEGKTITIDFAPSLDDGGIIFEGQIGEERISGLWMFKSFLGTQPQGRFEAVKK